MAGYPNPPSPPAGTRPAGGTTEVGMTAQESFSPAQGRPWLKVYRELGVTPAAPEVQERSLADYVEDNVRNVPGKVALVYTDKGVEITWQQLDALANRFAALLRALGMQKGDVLGIHLPNTPQYVVALIGAAKAGVAVSGVSPLLTPPEITHQVNDAHIKVLLTLDALYANAVAPVGGDTPTLKHVLLSGPIDHLPGWKKWLAYKLKKVPTFPKPPMRDTQVLDYWTALNAQPATRVYTKINFNDTIYIQYTGGTTGKPKGAELTLKNMFSNARQGEAFSPYEKGNDVIGAAFPFFHMAGLSLVLVSMQNAAKFLVVPDPRNVDMFCNMMKQHPPTVLANVPTLYMMLTESPRFREIDFSKLRVALSGAAPFPVEAIRKLEAIIGEKKLCEVYGMTESSPLLTSNPPQRPKTGSVGIPVVGTDLRIVDVETGTKEMPIGEPGEIIARGPQIMKGYLNLPDASAKTLREFDGQVYLYTGDVASMDDEGYLTICDRSKDMLIVGGYKVFSVEVESKLKELAFIELCALIGLPDEKRPGNDIVSLHVQLTEAAKQRDRGEIEQEILAFCRATMAPYKVPRSVHFHDALPLTAVGKLDKKALRAPK
jgi:long-chain acyl-CoA synthetase